MRLFDLEEVEAREGGAVLESQEDLKQLLLPVLDRLQEGIVALTPQHVRALSEDQERVTEDGQDAHPNENAVETSEEKALNHL